MTAIKDFDEFLRAGVVKKQSPDKSRAEYLIKESDQNFETLNEMLDKIEINDIHANNYIKNCYDIIMELVRAKMLLDGYNASGFGAHEAEVSYLRRLGFKENEVQFAEQLRYFRNGMLYYGTILDKEYALKVIEFARGIRLKIKKMMVKKGR